MTTTKTLTIRVQHSSSIPHARWCEPVGWTPTNEFSGSEFVDGSWWNATDETAGLIVWTDANEGDVIEVPASEIGVAYCGDCRVIGPVEVDATPTTRTISSVTVSVARDSMNGIDLDEYLGRLEAAIREMPDVTEDTEINVFASGESRYEGLYSDSQPWQYDALTDRLNAIAEGVFSEMCRGTR